MLTKIKNDKYTLEYSTYFNKVIFVHYFIVTPSQRGKGYARLAFDEIKKLKLPIALEAHPTKVEFYKKLGFHKSNDGRDGYSEMNWSI